MSASATDSSQPNDSTISTQQQLSSTSKTPLLGEGFQESADKPVSRSAESSDVEGAVGETGDSSKPGKRRLFGFGKKKHDEKSKNKNKDEEKSGSSNGKMATPIEAPVAIRPLRQSPPPKNHPYNLPTSPQRGLYSDSSRLVSPAGSQIFERDVQESTLPGPQSPAIPSHIQTENHIPPVLDASSEAITNEKLDTDAVEIVMHSSHQPAAVTVTGITSEPSGVWGEELVIHPEREEVVSSYAALDSADVRRLSFISFSDIVQSEHAEHAGNRDSIYVAGLSTLSSVNNRSPSPIRSPVSSQGRTSPPTSNSASVVEMSPKRRPLGSPILTTHPVPTTSGELTIETMTQALRRTGSGDLSGVRSQPLSPSSPTEGPSDRSFR